MTFFSSSSYRGREARVPALVVISNCRPSDNATWPPQGHPLPLPRHLTSPLLRQPALLGRVITPFSKRTNLSLGNLYNVLVPNTWKLNNTTAGLKIICNGGSYLEPFLADFTNTLVFDTTQRFWRLINSSVIKCPNLHVLPSYANYNSYESVNIY